MSFNPADPRFPDEDQAYEHEACKNHPEAGTFAEDAERAWIAYAESQPQPQSALAIELRALNAAHDEFTRGCRATDLTYTTRDNLANAICAYVEAKANVDTIDKFIDAYNAARTETS